MGILFVAIIIGLIPAAIARSKGRSFVLWWIYGAAIFIIALPHALLMDALPDSDDALKKEAIRIAARGQRFDRTSDVDFVADGVILGIPFRNEDDGAVTALVSGKTIKFRNRSDLELMLQNGVR